MLIRKRTVLPAALLILLADLKVAVSDKTWHKLLRCTTTTCNMPEDSTYIWFRNGQSVTNEYRNDLCVYSGDAGSYSCALFEQQEFRSPAVCLKVTISDWFTSFKKLSCYTTCTLSNNPFYIWYKNGQLVPNEYRNELYIYSGNADSYSCAVTGHDDIRSPAVYPPKNTTAVTFPPGETVEGVSVTLSCSSDANPPDLTYTWFKQSEAADTLITTGQNYRISNVSSQHSGLYYCTALNQLGHQNSTPTHLDVFSATFPPRETVEGSLVTLSCSSDANPPDLTYTWFKQSEAADTLITTGQNYSISNVSSQHSGLYYCTALNQLGHQNSTPTHLDVFSVTSDRTQTAPSEDQDNVEYTTVRFRPPPKQEMPLYSTLKLSTLNQVEEEVEYAAVSLVKSRPFQ
ncbi:B-cell receptor CD22 [Bagarius yarrelli]|uniref:B-cell receptor CD22 n=1 Tax=Bagarius yarrelli TaxID=175774 RepID=A0A556TTV4_BAGYA|nr:B-cell receptor CD22 [Bagarius yarrelli]